MICFSDRFLYHGIEESDTVSQIFVVNYYSLVYFLVGIRQWYKNLIKTETAVTPLIRVSIVGLNCSFI